MGRILREAALTVPEYLDEVRIPARGWQRTHPPAARRICARDAGVLSKHPRVT